jgi:hypothetical protein
MVTVLHVIEQNSVTENKATKLQQRNRIGLFNWMIRDGISVSHDGVESCQQFKLFKSMPGSSP